MLTMDQYEFIRTAHRVYGKNISELSRMTGHSRNTIKKALRGEYSGYQERGISLFLFSAGPYLGIIDEWLLDDLRQPKKQHHTARPIFNRFVAAMEDLPKVYHLPYEPDFPVVCMDESCKHLLVKF